MSLLGTQVYANPAKTCWLPVSGNGTIDGNLVVTGDIVADPGNIRSRGDNGTDSTFTLYDPTGVTTRGQLSTDNTGGGNLYLEAQNAIGFGKVGAGATANTTLTLSAPGANLDLLAVGGRITSAPGLGINPSGVTFTNPNSITLNNPAATLTYSPAFPLVAGAEYDIQLTGYWSVSAGVTTPATGDYTQIRVEVGTGISPLFYDKILEVNQYPAFAEDVWTSASVHPFQSRARVKGANIPNLIVTAGAFGTGVYPGGTIELYITTLDLVRVA